MQVVLVFCVVSMIIRVFQVCKEILKQYVRDWYGGGWDVIKVNLCILDVDGIKIIVRMILFLKYQKIRFNLM